MVQDNDKKWFPTKKYGIGWGLPVTWQGWIVLLSYTLLIIIGGITLTNPPDRIPLFLAYTFILTGLLILICWKKGEKLNFRWGKK